MSRRRVLTAVCLACLVGAAILFSVRSDPRAREMRRVQARLLGLAEAVSFGEKDSLLQRLAYADRVAAFLAPEVSLDISIGPQEQRGSLRRSELQERLAGVRARIRGLDVHFLDIAPELDEAMTAATAHLTSKIVVVGEPDYWIQELRLLLQKRDGEWLVKGVTTVRTMER